jgi:RNA polymerase sigma-70 factor (ECF subfamily)
LLTVDDREGVEQLYREKASALWRAIYGYAGGRREVADDVVAEAFALSIEHWPSIRNPTAWVYRTAFRLATRELQRLSSLAPLAAIRDEPVAAPDLTDLMAGLSMLSLRQRMAMVLYYVADLSVADVAAAMGVTTATVRVHLFTGRRRLRALLEKAEEAQDGK